MPNQPAKAKVFLIDDHPLVREHLSSLLQAEPDLSVCGTAADAPMALALIGTCRPDLVILDVSLKHFNGLDLLKDLRQLLPGLRVLVLSMHDEPRYAERALRDGAFGYITKEEASVDVLTAVRQVLTGQVYLSARMAGRLRQKTVASAVGRVLTSPTDAQADEHPKV